MAILPMNADVLMLGVEPEYYDHYQRMVKGGLQSMSMGWNYVANPAESFEYAVEFIGKRPELDLVYISNGVKRSEAEMRDGANALIKALAVHPAKPWVVLNGELDYLRPVFESAGINVEYSSIEIGLAERHVKKQRAAYTDEAS